MDTKKKRLAALTFLALVLTLCAAELLIYMHPFGYVTSVIFGILIVAAVVVVFRRLIQKRFRASEFQKAFNEVTDQALKANDDPNEPARWVP